MSFVYQLRGMVVLVAVVALFAASGCASMRGFMAPLAPGACSMGGG